jgi:hypothetical protein
MASFKKVLQSDLKGKNQYDDMKGLFAKHKPKKSTWQADFMKVVQDRAKKRAKQVV